MTSKNSLISFWDPIEARSVLRVKDFCWRYFCLLFIFLIWNSQLLVQNFILRDLVINTSRLTRDKACQALLSSLWPPVSHHLSH